MVSFRKARRSLSLVVIALALGGAVACSSSRQRRSNVLEYLYPEGASANPASSVQLDLPLNVGIAFVPEASSYGVTITPDERQALLERVRQAFAGKADLGRIEVVPESFVAAGGGFDNVRQIRSALGVDLIALVSYDQTQFDDPNIASITYWTIVGAYVIPGNENETHTLVHASVFHIESEVLLLNTSGQSTVEGSTTAMNLERAMREDRVTGFQLAVDDMIVNLDAALTRFREQVKDGTVRGEGTPAVEVSSAAGSSSGSGGGLGAGGLGPLGLFLGLLFFLAVPPPGRRA